MTDKKGAFTVFGEHQQNTLDQMTDIALEASYSALMAGAGR